MDEDFSEIYEKGIKDLVSYRKIFLANDPEDEVEAAPFHYDWSQRLIFGEGHEAIEGFRESGKSQYILRAFPLYALTFPNFRFDYIVIIKNNKNLARAKILEVEEEACRNPLINSRFEDIKAMSGDVFSVDVRKKNGDVHNIRIEAYGKGQSIRGLANIDRRPKIVIIDDPQDLDDSRSDTVQEADWNWFKSDVLFLGKKSRIFLIGNNLGEKCIIERVFSFADDLKFRTSKVKILAVNDKGQDVSTWPARNSVEEIYDEKTRFAKIGELDTWLREKMCEAVSEETRIFKKEDFRYYGDLRQGEDIAQECNVYLTMDPAASPNPESDYRAMVVVGVNQDNYWFVLDCSYGRYDPFTTIDEIFRLVSRWKLKEIGIEEGSLKHILEPFILKEMPKRKIFFNIIPLKARAKKEERIKLMQPRFRAHTVFFPTEAPWLPEMVSELQGFTMSGSKTLHDDVIDALAFMEQVAVAPVGSVNASNLPREAEG